VPQASIARERQIATILHLSQQKLDCITVGTAIAFSLLPRIRQM
jgi:hypothetical protein